MANMITSFLREEEGASAVEYGLVVGLIAVALVVVLGLLGGNLKSMFGVVKDNIPTTAPTN